MLRHPHLKDINLPAALGPKKDDLLISSDKDCSEAFILLEVRRDVKRDPFANLTCLARHLHFAVTHLHWLYRSPKSLYRWWCFRIVAVRNGGLDDLSWSQQDKAVTDFWERYFVMLNDNNELPNPLKDVNEPLPNNCHGDIETGFTRWKTRNVTIWPSVMMRN